MRRLLVLLLGAILIAPLSGASWYKGKDYQFALEPIDVVIISAEKDYELLDLVIQQVKENVKDVRRIIVVSSRQATLFAEWFDEKLYPFTKDDIGKSLFKIDSDEWDVGIPYGTKHRVGWYYQQLLKLYAPFVIPNISSNVLIMDSDVIFLNPTRYITPRGEPRFACGEEFHHPYFQHMEKFLPGLRRVCGKSGIAHHMLFQRCVLQDLFALVEKQHQMPFWRAFCHCVDPQDVPGAAASEYEIYFNFLLDRSRVHLQINVLKWADSTWHTLEDLAHVKSDGYNFVAAHHYLRKGNPWNGYKTPWFERHGKGL